MSGRAVRTLGVLLLLVPFPLRSQQEVGISVSNFLRYGTGEERVGTLTSSKEYLENLTETRISVSDFLVGFRLLFDAPPEYGVPFAGMRKRYVEFRKEDLTVRAGDSFTLLGRGLALNTFESRGLAFDTGIDGIKLEYRTPVLDAVLTGGDLLYRDVMSLDRTEAYRLRAGMVRYRPLSPLELGMSFAGGESSFPPPTFPDQRARFDIPEYFARATFGALDLAASYAEKRTTVLGRGPTHRGTAFYGTLSYAAGSFGLSLEVKDYRFGIADPYDRANPNRATRMFAFQNPPIVHREDTFTLLTRAPHVIDFNDETGAQIDLFYTVWERLTGLVNLTIASRHYSFTPTGDTNQIFLPVFGSVSRPWSFLPSFSSRYSPFWELSLEWQYFLDEEGTGYVQTGFNRWYDEEADEILSASASSLRTDVAHSVFVPLVFQYPLGSGWAVKFVTEHQWLHDEKNSAQTDYTNHFFSAGVSLSPSSAATLRYEYTTDRATVDGRRHWAAVDLSHRLSAAHTLTLTAGADRGGQICANGVCRVVNPFAGVRASMLSYF
ncbi:MAG: DUF6029 family protein [Bacteroidota bacterium]